MRLSFYMPFKPPGHVNPSGDLIIGRELSDSFAGGGHTVRIASRLRSRWIYWKPQALVQASLERQRVCREFENDPTDLWFTYHSYYKAPDLLGPSCSARLGIPYVIFQGIYSTKRRRSLKTLPGFLLNRRALMAATMVYTNKLADRKNLLRLLPEDRLLYIAPGIHPRQFDFDPAARKMLRTRWRTDGRVVVLTAAMFRPGVKTEGLEQVIASCGALRRNGKNLLLVIAGDGQNRTRLEEQARNQLGPDHLFVGTVPREDLYRYYSAADIFAFPGIQESLGMVFLEAQSVGLPIVAFRDWGAREAVINERTGILTPAAEPKAFTEALSTLLGSTAQRRKLGETGRSHIRDNHDISRNYQQLMRSMEHIVEHHRSS